MEGLFCAHSMIPTMPKPMISFDVETGRMLYDLLQSLNNFTDTTRKNHDLREAAYLLPIVEDAFLDAGLGDPEQYELKVAPPLRFDYESDEQYAARIASLPKS